MKISSLFLRKLRKVFLGISTEQTTFRCRKFYQGESSAQKRLERIGFTFLQGYHAAIEAPKSEALVLKLNSIESEFRGFAFEGAAMGLGLLDSLTPWKRKRFQHFLEVHGNAHTYMMYVGLGWVMARLRQNIKKALAELDPLLGWLAIDGYGFHEGYFHGVLYINGKEYPKQISGYAAKVFDQGLGRSLWFVQGADVAKIAATINKFDPRRHADLWSGVGLACAYAGGVHQTDVEALWTLAGSYQPCLAQGAAFAAKARQKAGNPADCTALACQIFCDLSLDSAAEITDLALEQLPVDGVEPAYELWRRKIQSCFARRSENRTLKEISDSVEVLA